MMKILFLLLIIVVGWVNWICFLGYSKVSSIYNEGERITATAVETIKKRGKESSKYKYKFVNSKNSFVLSSRDKVKLHQKVNLVVYEGRAIVVEKRGSYFEIFMGGGRNSTSPIFFFLAHLSILCMTFALISSPREIYNAMLKGELR